MEEAIVALSEPRQTLLTSEQAAEYLGVPLSYFRQVVRWEIAVIKTSPGRNGRIYVEPAELDRWKVLHREAPAFGHREVPVPNRKAR